MKSRLCGTLRTVMPLLIGNIFSKFWNGYIKVRRGPTSFGPALTYKLFVISLYAIGVGLAAWMTVSTLRHKPIFKTVTENGEGSYFEPPSLIICQNKKPGYKYGFFSKYDRKTGLRKEEELGLSTNFVNFLAEKSYKNKLDSSASKDEMKKYSTELGNLTRFLSLPLTPRKIWELILYRDPHKEEKNLADAGYNLYVNVDTHGQYYRRQEMSLIWLTNRLQCFFFNHTGQAKEFKAAYYRNRIITHFDGVPKLIWLGNIAMEQISFSTYESPISTSNFIISTYHLGDSAKRAACQPLLGGKCARNTDNLERKASSSCWQHVISISYKSETDVKNYDNCLTSGSKMCPYRLQEFEVNFDSAGWLSIIKIEQFNSIRIIETMGTLFGVWVGFSIFSVFKAFLAVVKTSVNSKKFPDWVFVIVQICFIIVLAIATGVLQYINLKQLAKTRFLTEFQVVWGDGVPYQNFSICPRYITRYNGTIIREYKISHPLLVYIQSTAILERSANYISKNDKKPFFLWDKEAPRHIGFHWNFMEFPLQHFGEEIYEKYMTKIETQYVQLSRKFGVDPMKPSWYLLEKLLLDPCKVIKYCLINGKRMRGCCKLFTYSIERGTSTSLCWTFKNKDSLKQTQPGEDFGFKVVMDPAEWNHTMSHYYVDDFMMDYVVNNCSARNCSIKYPSTWNPWNAVQTFMNKGFTEISFSYVRKLASSHILPSIKLSTKTEIVMSQSKKLSYKDDSCSDANDPPVDKTLYIQREIVKEWCGCSACIPFPIYQGQNFSCCTPKHLGRCLTQKRMHTSLCKKDGSPNYLQGQYAGNLPSLAPVNVFLMGMRRCDFGTLFENVTSPFYQVYRKIKPRMKSAFKPNCFSSAVAAKIRKLYDRTLSKMPKKKFLAKFKAGEFEMNQNAYYAIMHYRSFMERDLQNFWEILSLFFGVMGLLMGISFIVIFEVFWLSGEKVFKMCTRKKNSQNNNNFAAKHLIGTLSSDLVAFSLGTVTKQMKSLQNKEAASVPSVPAEAMYAVPEHPCTSHGTQNCPNLSKAINSSTDLVLQVPSSQNNVNHAEPEHPCTSNGTQNCPKHSNGINSSAVLILQVPSSQNNVNHGDSQSNNASDEKKEDPLSKKIFLSVMLVLCIIIMSYSMNHLHGSMDKDGRITYVDFAYSGIVGPTVAFCLPVMPSESVSSMQLMQKNLSACKVASESVDCRHIFGIFLRTKTFDCLLSRTQLQNGSGISHLHASFTSDAKIWMGNIGSLTEGIVLPDQKALGNYVLQTRYHEWERIDEPLCNKKTSSDVECPLCKEHTKLSAGFCCWQSGMLVPRFNETRTAQCTESFYSLSHRLVRKSSCDSDVKNLTSGCKASVNVGPFVQMKRTINQIARRGRSEQFMLYGSYVKRFTGLNIDHTVYTAITAVFLPLWAMIQGKIFKNKVAVEDVEQQA